MKEKCHCGKEAKFIYHPTGGEPVKHFCPDHVPEIVLLYEFCPEGILHWAKQNPFRSGEDEKTEGI